MTKESSEKGRIHLAVIGHVDHGKSTIVGRLLAETSSIHANRIADIYKRCEEHGKSFEYAFLLDSLADEQAQGITIDTTRIFFGINGREFIVLDAPGHIEFLRNMVTGAAHADAAILVIDAAEGVQENTKRHAYLLSVLGIKQVVVAVNKMDLVCFDKAAFERAVADISWFLAQSGIEPLGYIPVSGLTGDNIASRSTRMPWHDTPLLQMLSRLEAPGEAARMPFRMFVQDVYKFTRFGDNRRIAAGTIQTGELHEGDELVFYPSQKRTAVRNFISFGEDEKTKGEAGEAVAFTLADQVYLARGELAASVDEPNSPRASSRIKASVFWLGKQPLCKNKDYGFKLGTAKATAQIESFSAVLDSASLERVEGAEAIEQNMAGECVFKLNHPLAFDEAHTLAETSRFVLVDGFTIAGGGIVREALEDSNALMRGKSAARNARWIRSFITRHERTEKYNQKPQLILITGEKSTARKSLGRALEAKLFNEGKIVYFLAIANIIHGLDADIEGKDGFNSEHIRRLAELANIMLDAGLLFIVSAQNLSRNDLQTITTVVGAEMVKTVWVGPNITTDIPYDLHLPDEEDLNTALTQIKELLYSSRIVFRPW